MGKPSGLSSIGTPRFLLPFLTARPFRSDAQDDFLELWQAALPQVDADTAGCYMERGLLWKDGKSQGIDGKAEWANILKDWRNEQEMMRVVRSAVRYGSS